MSMKISNFNLATYYSACSTSYLVHVLGVALATHEPDAVLVMSMTVTIIHKKIINQCTHYSIIEQDQLIHQTSARIA